MAKKKPSKEQNYKLGPLEFEFKFTNTQTGAETIGVSTPSIFGRVNDYIDTIRASETHTELWCVQRQADAMALLTAKREGLVKADGITTEAISDFLNTYEYDLLDKPEADAPDPSQPDPDADQEAGAGD